VRNATLSIAAVVPTVTAIGGKTPPMSPGNIMGKHRSFFYDIVFVVVIMVAAMASAVLEAAAVLGAFPTIDFAPAVAQAAPSGAPRPVAVSSSVDGALLSAAAPRPAR
jgi:hypothetical protein